MDIRKEFLQFFAGHGHEIYPSAPLVPDDATLLFTNAGMVPFKNIFTGAVPPPVPPRRTTCQTCIRAGGKHNDLENVGYTARHHTFFEMLGNFSFGDYFKAQVIPFAWEFVTQVLELPKDKLYVTVHESDDEAFEIWSQVIDAKRIYRFGDHDNFWAMGDTGPCGPCSEIFYDQGEEHFRGSEDYMGGDGDRFLEIWNLVFMQFERSLDGTMSALPKPSIDTGMGLERVTAIKEGKFSNYDSSLFMPLIDEVARMTGKRYEYESGAGMRVIADHIRAVTFLLAQGVNFDKEGRGYVLRRILRRAVRHGYLLGLKKPFMHELSRAVVAQMGDHYTYLRERADAVREMIALEEERFYATLASGISLFNDELSRTKDKFSGEVAFKLYDTYGFPFDLTQDMLRDRGISADSAKFDELMSEQKARAKASWKGSGDHAAQSGDFKALIEKFGVNKFIGYDTTECDATILALLDSEFHAREQIMAGNNCWVMLDRTPFYATSGGQSADTGTLAGSAVVDTQKFYELNLCKVEASTTLSVGQSVHCVVSAERAQTARHHSATHLLHYALRAVLGSGVAQAGSMVAHDRLRFDFSYPKAMSAEQVAKVQEMVNEMISRGGAAHTEIMNIDEAKNSGAMALFGEKYGESVRVVSIGETKELCGGTHVKDASEIGAFFIIKESGVSAGVRRIEAVCASSAVRFAQGLRDEIAEISAELKSNEPIIAIKKLKEQIKELKNELKRVSAGRELGVTDIAGTAVCVDIFDGDIKAKIDELKNRHERAVVVLARIEGERVQLACGVKGANIKAGELIKATAGIVGGGGGGRDDFATAGGKDASKLGAALEFAMNFIKEKLA